MVCVLWIIGLFVLTFNILEALCQKTTKNPEVVSYQYNAICDKVLNRIMRELRKKSSIEKKEVLKYTTPIKLSDGSQIKEIDVFNVSRMVRRTMSPCGGAGNNPFRIDIPFEIPRIHLSALFYPKSKNGFGIAWVFGQIKGYLHVQFYKNGTFANADGSNIYEIRLPIINEYVQEKASEIFDITAEEAHIKFVRETVNKLLADFDHEKFTKKLTEMYLEKVTPVLKSMNWKEWYAKIEDVL